MPAWPNMKRIMCEIQFLHGMMSCQTRVYSWTVFMVASLAPFALHRLVASR